MTSSGPGAAADSQTSVIEQRISQVQAFRAQVTSMPREAVRGYPVPFAFEGEAYLALPFFLRKGMPPAPPQMGTPRWVVYIDVATGLKTSFRELEADPSVMLGPHKIDPPLEMAAFAAAEKQMYLLMAELLPMLRNPGAGVPSALVDRAIAFVRLWRQLSHKPLAAHYRALNPAWFEALGI